jgi:hypothetical protein
MTNRWKVFATLLLCNLAVVAWADDAKLERREVPPGVNDNRELLDVRGVFEAKDLVGQLIVLYQDPADGSFGYTLQEGPTTGEDVLDLGDLKLALTFADEGDLKTVELWENGTWSTVGELEAKAIKKGTRPLPDFDQVPEAPKPCEEGIYQKSLWSLGCLVDEFSGCASFLRGKIACCDGGVGPFGEPEPDCQKDYDVPLPTAHQ